MHTNLNSKGSSAQRCAGFPKIVTSKLRNKRPSKHRFQRLCRVSADAKDALSERIADRQAAILALFRRDEAKRKALGINPKYRNQWTLQVVHNAWKKLESVWEQNSRLPLRSNPVTLEIAKAA